MRVLVTGGFGFIGQAVVHALGAAGHEVTVLARRSPSASTTLPDGVSLLTADLRDAATLREELGGRQFDGVCHLAGLARVRDSFERPLDFFDTNTTGTTNLLRALTDQATTPTAFVLASTGSVYGGTVEGAVGEDTPPRPDTPYAVSKWAAEQALLAHARTGAIGACVLRCFSVAGATRNTTDTDDTRIITKALRVAAGQAAGITVNGDGSAVREFTHVADVAAAFVRAVEATRPADTSVYNVGTGQGVTLMEVLNTVAAVTGSPIHIDHGPPRPEPRIVVADSTRIRAELGWTAPHSDLRTIIADAWQAQRS